ncbi:hypothetical protein [Sutcliffiella horikoshii]|uniref:Uncharacterized protein n=1 Tax=Sutcliffiella horikoshii TaxID=79883 RepID=A0A5D4TGX4_9BACI|nr:hypothetical protein [Sutcliffiella horikoshii]TYS74525.1 hypothetical protein FZC75_02170 [Sutcliffiella horikoshii]
MVEVYGTIQDRPLENEKLDFEIQLNVPSIYDKDMPIPESTKLIVDEINRKYKTNYSYSCHINPLHIK